MADIKSLRKHPRKYRMLRWLSKHPVWLHKFIAWLSRHTQWLRRGMAWVARKLSFLGYLNVFRYIKRLDWYIIKKFIGTYIYSILLIISISIVFDVNENLAKFTQYHAPLRAIVFDYYLNFIPYFANLFSPLFVFIAVIFFTSKLAGNSEIISMLAAGVSFKRLMRPYMISCVLISSLSFYLSAYVIPHGTVIRQNFDSMYRNRKKNTSAENVQLQVGKGVIAYMQYYDNNTKRGNGFSLDKFENKKLVSHLTAMEIQYDTISDSKYHWKIRSWKCRELKGLKEHITSGGERDTVIMMEPTDLVYSKGQQETFTLPDLKEYISKQKDRGSGNPHHHRLGSILAQTQRWHGIGIGRRLGSELRLYHASNGIGNICHQRKSASYHCSMDSKPHLRCCGIHMLSSCSKLMNIYMPMML